MGRGKDTIYFRGSCQRISQSSSRRSECFLGDRKGGKPFETNIEKISVEKYFYGKEGEISADDEITDLESGYAEVILILSGAKRHGTQVSDRRAGKFCRASNYSHKESSGIFSGID